MVIVSSIECWGALTYSKRYLKQTTLKKMVLLDLLIYWKINRNELFEPKRYYKITKTSHQIKTKYLRDTFRTFAMFQSQLRTS